MNDRLKVMTVVGTRPEIIRLSRVMAALDASPSIEHIIVHTGQNYDYELNQIFFDDLEGMIAVGNRLLSISLCEVPGSYIDYEFVRVNDLAGDVERIGERDQDLTLLCLLLAHIFNQNLGILKFLV